MFYSFQDLDLDRCHQRVTLRAHLFGSKEATQTTTSIGQKKLTDSWKVNTHKYGPHLVISVITQRITHPKYIRSQNHFDIYKAIVKTFV